MKYTLSDQIHNDPSVGHDDDQQVTFVFGEDLSALKEIDELEDGQPSASTESFYVQMARKTDMCADQPRQDQGPRVPFISRVIDANGNARISIYFGEHEKNEFLGQVIGVLDTASENDVVDLTIAPNYTGECNTYCCRSILSAINRCKAHVITHAGFITSTGDLVIWLSGNDLRWHKSMTGIFIRQLIAGYGGDIADLEVKSRDAISSFKEYSDYIVARGLFTAAEMKSMYETRGMLSLHGKELEARIARLKPIED